MESRVLETTECTAVVMESDYAACSTTFERLLHQLEQGAWHSLTIYDDFAANPV